MNKILTIILAMTAMCVVVSCSDDDEVGSEYLAAKQISVARSTVSDMPAEGGEGIVEIQSSRDVSVSSNSAWCSFSMDNGVIKVIVEPNTGLEGRTAILTITDGSETMTVPVLQRGMIFEVSGEKSITLAGHIDEKVIRTVSHTYPVSVSATEDWIDAAVDGDELTISIAKGNGQEPVRKGVVKVSSCGYEDQIEITQYDFTGAYNLSGYDAKGQPISYSGNIIGGETVDRLYFCPSDFAGVQIPMNFSLESLYLSFSAGSYCQRYGRFYVYSSLVDVKTVPDPNHPENKGAVALNDTVIIGGNIMMDSGNVTCSFSNEGKGSWLSDIMLSCGNIHAVTFTATTFRLNTSTVQNIALARNILMEIEQPVLDKIQ